MESRLPSFEEFLKKTRSPSDGETTVDWDPCRTTSSAFKHCYAYNASTFEKPETLDTRRRFPCRWQGCSYVSYSCEDQSAHEALHQSHRSSINSDERPRLSGDPEDSFPSREKRQCVSRYDVHSTGHSILTNTESSASTRTLRADPSFRWISSQRHTAKTDSLDGNQLVEPKVAHKRAERKRRSEFSSLITEVEHRLPPQFLEGCQHKNQRPGKSIYPVQQFQHSDLYL